MHHPSYDQLVAWVQHFSVLHRDRPLEEIAEFEKVHVVIDDLRGEGYHSTQVDGVKVVMLNQHHTIQQRREWLIGALAAEKIKDGVILPLVGVN